MALLSPPGLALGYALAMIGAVFALLAWPPQLPR